MPTVADTSPLTYLVRVESVEILPTLFQAIVIPPEVREELLADEAPTIVRAWASNLPDWVEVHAASAIFRQDPRLRVLDSGETAVIALAMARKQSLVLMDERKGSRVASNLGLSVTGTLGVLRVTARRNLISLPEVIGRLQRTSFRYPKTLVDQMLAEDARRRSGR